jgi:ABC-type transport system substrate-binding protein
MSEIGHSSRQYRLIPLARLGLVMMLVVLLGGASLACSSSDDTATVAATAVPQATAAPEATSEDKTEVTPSENQRPIITQEIINTMTELDVSEVTKYFPRKYPAEFEYSDIKRGGVFTIATTWDLAKWDPRMTAAGGTMAVSNMVYMTMTMFDVGPDADPLTPPIGPRLAESWEFNDDATQLTYHLHEGMHWGDIDDKTKLGPEIVAEDIAWVFNEYKTNSVHTGAHSTVSSVETPDKYTLVVNFTQPSLWFLGTMSIKDQPIFNPHLFKAGRQDHEAIGPGPFMLEKALKSIKVELSANPNFYFKDDQGGQLPYMDGVTFLIVTDASTRVALMRTGKIESAYSPLDGTLPTAQALLKTNPDMVLQTIETTRLSPITFQQNDPVWGGEAGKVARQAVSLAIDTRGIADVLFNGLTAPLPVRVNFYDFMEKQPTWDQLDELREEWYGPNMYQYDPEKAKELWDSTGLGEISETLEFYAYNTTLVDGLGQYVSDLQRNLGWDIKLNSMDYSAFNGPLAAGTHKGLFWAWAAAFPDVGGQLFQRWNVDGSVNRENLNDPILNEATGKMLVAQSADELKALTKTSMLRWGEMVYGVEATYAPSVQVGGYPLQPYVRNFRYGNYSGGYYYYGQALQTTWLDR